MQFQKKSKMGIKAKFLQVIQNWDFNEIYGWYLTSV